MRVRWTEGAARDLTAICDYTEVHNGAPAARRVALRIYERITSLPQFPNIGRTGQKKGTRELVIDGLPFLAVYRLRNELIEIIRILHGAQRWP